MPAVVAHDIADPSLATLTPASGRIMRGGARSPILAYDDGYAAGVASVVSDATPPTITVISPTPGVAPGQPGGFPPSYVSAKAVPIVLEVTDLAPGVAYVALLAVIAGTEEVVYRRDAFRGVYASGSTVEAIAGGFRFTLRRDGGWPPGSITLDVDAIDGTGNLAA